MACSSTATQKLCKKAGETRRYSMDFETLMIEAETIVGTPTVVDATGELTISSIAISGQTVLATIAGGVRGKTYSVVYTVSTSGGQILIGEGPLAVI
jgi:hypothetical protein